MQTKQQISLARKFLYGIMLLGIIFSAIGTGSLPNASAQEAATATPTPQSDETPQPQVKAQSEPIPSQIIIQFKPKATEKEKKALAKTHGGAIVQRIDALNVMVIRLPNNGQGMGNIKSPIIERIEQDYYIDVLDDYTAPNDPLYAEQWALPAIGAPYAWAELPADAPKVIVAVIDSGICASHPDLAGRIEAGWDFLENDDVPQDDFGHGCSVAGVIAANMNDGIGIAGVAPNAQIMPLRVLNASGIGSYSDVAAAIVYAADNGAQVINLSLGGSSPSSTLESAVNYAISKGVIVVAAAGNNGTEGALYPAAYPDVIAVGSVDPNLQHSSFSNHGSQIDIWAPGRDILTTKRDGSYGLVSGTSFAAPYVAGAKIIQKDLVINGQFLDLRTQWEITPSVATTTPTTYPSQTPIVSSTPQVQIPGYYIEQSGKYSFSYPLDWELTDDKYFDNENEIAIDSFVEIVAPDKEAITIRTFNNILPSPINDSASIFLYPVLADTALDYGTGSINGNAMIMAIEPGEKEVTPTVLYALFQCNSTVYRIQYIGYNGGTNVQDYQQLLDSFKCDLSVQSENTRLPEVDQKDFVPAPSMLIKPSENCPPEIGYSDPTNNRFECGQCTWWASYSRPDIPDGNIWRYPAWTGSGDAHLWDDIALENNLEVSTTPEVGAIAVWEANSDGTGSAGHVAYVIKNNFNGTFVVTDMNWGCPSDGTCAPRERTVTDTTNIDFILGGVTFFEDQNFGGRQSPLIRSNQSSLNYGWDISSVFIPAGWDAVFYRNNNYDSSSWRERFGAQTFSALNSSFWNLQLDYFSDGTNMNDNVRSARVGHTMCINPYGLSGESANNLGCGDDGTIPDTNPPTGTWSSPSNNSTISSSNVTLTVNASDTGGSGVKEVRWSAKWGGNWYGIGTDTSAPYSMSWNMCNSGVPNGDVELGFEVWDNAGNKWVYSSQNANYHINKNYTCNQSSNDTTPPTAAWTSPSGGSTINSRTVTLSANASDNAGGSGVREVRWSAKWNNTWSGIGSDSTYPYSMSWDMCNSGVPKGDVELGMEVWDNANNVWIYSQHHTNIHINMNFDCGGNTGTGDPLAGAPWNTHAWQNKYMAGYTNWEGTFSWGTYPYINFDWGSGAPFGWGGDEFSMKLWRNVYFPGGYYSFMTKHNDGVKVYLDGNLIIDAWWDGDGGHDAGRNVSAGYHEVKVEYYENQGDAKLQVVWYGPGYPAPDNNPPDGKITSPVHLSATSNSTLNISADAWDDASGVDRVDFYAWYCYQNVCDWRKLGTDYSSPYTYNWNWGYLPDLHVWLSIDVFDKTGKQKGSAGGWVEVDLDRSNPTASITSPAADSYLSINQIIINAAASDNGSGVQKVQFFAGYNETAGAGAQGEIAPPLPYYPEDAQGESTDITAQDYWHEIGWDEDGSNGWSFTWNSASVPDQGGAAFFIYAYDKAGNYQGAQVWPVMLDRVAPFSAINTLPQYTGTTSFTVSWAGTDAISGIANYDIQYQDNGGSWTNWLSATTSTSAAFNGVLGHTYTFRSRARDRAGNVENWPASADTQTTLVAVPSNNNFSTAVTISTLPYIHAIDTRSATTAADDPTPTCGYGKNSNSVWYKYAAPANGLLEIDTWGSDYDTVLAVYRGTQGNLTQVACNDDIYGYLEAWIDEIPVTANTTYYIEVMDYGSPGGGNLELYVNFAPTPSNDDFNSPITISSMPYNTTQDVRGATKASDDPSLTSCNRLPGSNSVWYKYTTSTLAGQLDLDTIGSTYDTMLAVWTGTRGNLTPIGCNDDIGYVDEEWDQDSTLTLQLQPSTTYYIEVSQYNGMIDINGASAAGIQEKPDGPLGDLSSLEDRKTAIDNGDITVSASQEARGGDVGAQLWGGQLQLHAAFHPAPTTPTLVSPTNGATLARTNNTVLDWNTTGTTCTVHVWGGSIDISPSGSCADLALGEQRGGTYSWQVTAENAYGSTTGPVWQFKVRPHPPTSLSGSAVSGTQVDLTWGLSYDEPADIDGYDIYRNTTLVRSVEEGIGQYSITSGITCNTSYSYYVRAKRQGVQSIDSNAIYITAPCAPAAFNKTSPSTSLTNRPTNLTLSWGTSANAARYEYCIDTTNDGECDAWISTGTVKSATLTNLETGTSYYWQVRAVNSIGVMTYANSNAWWSFTTGTLPTTFNKVEPANETIDISVIPTLIWTNSIDATSYKYCIDTINNNLCDSSWSSTVNTSATTTLLSPNTTYYWQVKGVNTIGETESDNDAWLSFTTKTLTHEQIALQSTASQDGHILESAETSNTGGTKNSGAATFFLGDNAQNKQYRSILSFNTSLPSNAIVTKVTLKIKYAGKAGTNPFSTHGKLLVDVRKGAFSNNSSLQLGDFKAAASKANVGNIPKTLSGGWYTKVWTSGIFGYINTSGVTQFRLRFAKDDNNDFGADYLKIYSGNSTAANRPQLIVEYYVP